MTSDRPTDSSPLAVMRRLGQIRAFAIMAIPVIAGGLWWMHQIDTAHALKHDRIKDRVTRVEKASTVTTEKMDGMALDIRGIMIAVGAERATREALHSRPAHAHSGHRGLLQSLPGAEGE